MTEKMESVAATLEPSSSTPSSPLYPLSRKDRSTLRRILTWLFTIFAVRAWILLSTENYLAADIEGGTSIKHSSVQPLPPIVHNASLVVQLGGEMGNQLSMISTGIALRRMARNHGINANIILRHQDNPKWVRARKATQECFINTRSMDFEAANDDEFNQIAKMQENWLGKENNKYLYLGPDHSTEDMEKSITFWKSVLDRDDRQTAELSGGDKSSPVSVPFLFVQHYVKFDLLDIYFDDIRDFFVFDYDRCCKLRASADEIVLHMRLFLTEMPRRGKSLGFEELSLFKVAKELFQNAKPGQNITILSRFNDHNVEPYEHALDNAGFHSSVLSGQEGFQDFCYLLSARKELVGMGKSTFAVFAAVLGNATKARLYYVESPYTKKLLEGSPFRHGIGYNWTHPVLKGKMSIEKYKSEEQDALEAREKNSTTSTRRKMKRMRR